LSNKKYFQIIKKKLNISLMTL